MPVSYLEEIVVLVIAGRGCLLLGVGLLFLHLHDLAHVLLVTADGVRVGELVIHVNYYSIYYKAR